MGRPVVDVERDIQTALDLYLKGALVKVRLLSYKVTILGEVRSPGTFYIYNDRLTLPEALGYAGDLTDLADRAHLRLIRRVGNQVAVYKLDLTDRRLLGSPFFYLQPNDAIYVEPIRSKADRLNLPAVSILISALTAVVVVIGIIVR